jgi:DNA-binding MarR family transcriptional regulator
MTKMKTAMKPQSEVWQQLRSVFESVENKVAKSLQREHGLGLTEYRALYLLSTAPESELRMQELASQLGLNQSSVTRLVARLERNGYTIRDVCPNDKRGVYTVITNRGRQVQEEASKDYEDFLTVALNEVSCQSDYQPIVESLRKVIVQQGLSAN